MSIILLIALLALLFYLIGLAADLVIDNAQKIGRRLRWPIFTLGLVIGLLTSLPEFSLGLQAVSQGDGALSFGNLTGGIIVLLGLVVGLSVLARGDLSTKHSFNVSEFLAVGAFIILPVALSFDGNLSRADGIILILGYILLAWRFITSRRKVQPEILIENSSLTNTISLLLVGVLAVVVLARLILKFSLELTDLLGVTQVVTGWIILAVGTNLPEIALAIRATKRKMRELSLGNLIGSALGNSLVLGILALPRGFIVIVDNHLVWLGFFTLLLLLAFGWFSSTGRKLTRVEGLILFLIYLIFVGGQLFFIFK